MVPSNARDMHQGFVSAITALSARFAVSADLNGGMVLWDLERHLALKSWTAHKEGVYGLTLAPTTKAPYTVRSCCASGRIKAWLVDTQSAGVQASPGRGDGDKVTSAAGASGATGSMSNAETSNTSHGWRYARVGDEWHANYDATRTVHAWSLLFLEGNRLACGQSDGDIAIYMLPPDGVGVGKAASHGAVASQPLPHPAADGGAWCTLHSPLKRWRSSVATVSGPWALLAQHRLSDGVVLSGRVDPPVGCGCDGVRCNTAAPSVKGAMLRKFSHARLRFALVPTRRP